MSDEAQEIAKKQYGNKIRVRACGICIENQQVLMICHKGVINDKDVWLPPGGGVEDGESITDALMREFLEETGFAMLPGEDFGFESNEMLSRIAFVDFDGAKALQNLNDENLNDQFIQEYCPKIYKGVESLCSYIKTL